jgi:hypothetical protein
MCWNNYRPYPTIRIDRGGLTYREIGNLPDEPVLVWAALYYYIITKNKILFYKINIYLKMH